MGSAEAALAFWIIVSGLAGAAVYLINIYDDGLLDARHPSVAGGDWRTGWRRRVYLAGYHREVARQRLVAERHTPPRTP